MNSFRSEFCDWLRLLNTTVDFGSLESGLSVVFNHGEWEHNIEPLPDGWMRITFSSRGGAPTWEFDAASLEVAEVYLSVRYANGVRDTLGLGSLDRRERVGRESSAMTRTVVDWIGPPIPEYPPLRMEVFSSNHTPFARFAYPLGEYTPQLGAPSREAGATWYIDKPLSEVLSALRHPTGSPLFELLGDRLA